MQADRTLLFQQIPRVASECRSLIAALNKRIPVLQLLENVSHGPKDVVQAMNEAMQGPPVTVYASSFRWVKRTRCFWGSNGQTSVVQCRKLKPPSQTRLDWDATGAISATWNGKKPFPATVAFSDKYVPSFHPVDNLGKVAPKAIFATFTRAFTHPAVPDVRASPEACARYQADGRVFPPFAYESHSLLWKGQLWRQLHAAERASLMCIPSSMLHWVEASSDGNASRQEVERKKASLVGNSFHVPSIMLALLLLFQLLPQATGVSPPMYAGLEQCLREQVRGSAFQPGLVDSCPDPLSAEQLLQDVRQQFAPLGLQFPDIHMTERARAAVRRLQIFKLDCILRDRREELGSPQWAQQRNAAKSAVALGTQRRGPLSKHAPQIFKPVEPAAPCPPDLQDELRERVPKAHAKLHLVLPRAEYAQELLDHTAQEIDQGWAEGLFTKTQLDQAFGEGNWLPMQRFMHVQPSGKLRPIDNGRSCGHNSLSRALETIITNTPDFAAAACKEFLRLMQAHFRQPPAWAVPVFGSEDMKSAYRQLPNVPSEAPLLVIAIWHPQFQEIRYAIMRAHPFGLSSAVLNFNRLPALATALVRQSMATAAAFYFDDTGVFDLACCRGSGQEALQCVYQAFGATLDELKQQPMAVQRTFLGVLLDFAGATDKMRMQIDVKPGLREALKAEITAVLQADFLSSGQASKLRGRFRWASSAMYGRCARGGQGALVRRQ